MKEATSGGGLGFIALSRTTPAYINGGFNCRFGAGKV